MIGKGLQRLQQITKVGIRLGGAIAAEEGSRDRASSEVSLVHLASAAQARREWQAAREFWEQVVLAEPRRIGGWVQLGNMNNELARYGEAISCFQTAGSLDPTLYDAPAGIAGVCERAGRWREALLAWEDAISLITGPERATARSDSDEDTAKLAHAYGHAALSAFHAGSEQRAADILMDAARDVPGFHAQPSGLLLRARLVSRDDPARALKLARRYFALSPGDADACFHFASVCLETQRYEEGLDLLQPALASRGEDVSFLWLAADLNDRLRRWPVVLQLSQRMAELRPNDPRYLRRAFVAGLEAGDLISARRFARAFALLTRGDYGLIHDLIDVYDAAGERNRARLLCRWLHRKWPHSQWHVARYIVLTATTRSLAEADRLLRAEIAARGPTLDLDRAYCEAASRTGNFAEARRRLAFFLQKHGDDENAQVLLGYVIANASGILDAERHFADFAARSYQARGAVTGLAHMAMRRRDASAVHERWANIVSLYPDDTISRVEYARSAYELRDYALAERICTERLAKAPSDVTVGEFYAWFLVATGRFQDALDYIGVLRRHTGPNWTVLELAVQSASQVGKLDPNWIEYLDLVPQDTAAKASKRFYHVVRQLWCAERTSLLSEAVARTAVEPRHLAWLSPYLRRQPAALAGDVRTDRVHQVWSHARMTVRDDAARLIRSADDDGIRSILAKSKSEHPVVHIVNKFEQMRGGSELHALDVAERVGRHARVELWAPEMPHPHFSAKFGVRAIEPGEGALPQGGVLVFIGVYFEIVTWLDRARPQRVIFLYNTFEAPSLFQRLSEVWEKTGVQAELLYCSDMMGEECGLPGLFEPSPTDIDEFSPRTRPHPPGHRFTLGRHSRDVMEKHHAEDWRVYQAVADAGGTSRILGGTCMQPVFPPLAATELLPARSTGIADFLRGLDAYYYRTSTWIEPWGRVVIEAMACGLPVIASAVGGYAQAITNGKDGLLFRTTDEAVDMVNRVATDPVLCERLGAEARRSAERLLSEAAMARIVAFYLAPLA